MTARAPVRSVFHRVLRGAALASAAAAVLGAFGLTVYRQRALERSAQLFAERYDRQD